MQPGEECRHKAIEECDRCVGQIHPALATIDHPSSKTLPQYHSLVFLAGKQVEGTGWKLPSPKQNVASKNRLSNEEKPFQGG